MGAVQGDPYNAREYWTLNKNDKTLRSLVERRKAKKSKNANTCAEY
jgi:hypothetical protein